MKVYYAIDLDGIYEPKNMKLPIDICISKEALYKKIIQNGINAGIPEYKFNKFKKAIQNGFAEKYMKKRGVYVVEQEVVE